jgi:hypothetical protein
MFCVLDTYTYKVTLSLFAIGVQLQFGQLDLQFGKALVFRGILLTL